MSETRIPKVPTEVAEQIARIVIESQDSARLYIVQETQTFMMFPNPKGDMQLFHTAAADLWGLRGEFPEVFRLKEGPNKRGPGSVIFINTNGQLIFSEEDLEKLDWKKW